MKGTNYIKAQEKENELLSVNTIELSWPDVEPSSRLAQSSTWVYF